MSIGSKIKSLRKKRGMTQAELADGIVTRGMLSRIEGESALPSMQSLTAIAEKLEVSPAFLLEDGSDILPAELARIEKAIENEYRTSNYQGCVDIFTLYQLESDCKIAPVFIACAFEVALEAFYVGDFEKARDLLGRIEKLLPSLLINSLKANENRVSFLRSVMDNIDCMETAVEISNDRIDFEFAPSLFFSLLKLLKNGRHDECNMLLKFCALDEKYKAFIDAQMYIKDYKFIDAILSMKTLGAEQSCPVFLKLLCLSSTENCCKLCEDYKGAYENHLAYQSLLSKIKR